MIHLMYVQIVSVYCVLKIGETEMAHSIWEREVLKNGELTDEQFQFLMSSFTENLNHARHVENERLTFNSIYMAIIAGALAVAVSIGREYRILTIGIVALLKIIVLIAMALTKKWDNTFDRHIEYAKNCYRVLHTRLFPRGDNEDAEEFENTTDIHKNEQIDGLDEFPAYCFRPCDPTSKAKFLNPLLKTRTRTMFFWFYLLIQVVLIILLVYFIKLL